MKSIRRYLTRWLLAGIGVTVFLSGAVMFVVAKDGLVREYDNALSGKAQALGTLLAEHEDGIELEFADEVMPEFHRRTKPEYFQIWLEDGVLVEKSNSLLDAKADLPQRFGTVDDPEAWDLELPDGRPGRATGIMVPVDHSKELETRPPKGARFPLAKIVVARGRNQLDRAITRLVWWLAGAVLVTCTAIVLIVAWTVRRGLAPLVDLGKKVGAIDAKSLASRLPTERQVRELAPLSGKLNELLARLEAAFLRERRMTSNLAHELRTPIAEIRAASDVAHKWPEDLALQKDVLEVARDVADRMTRVVDALLRLSRVEAGAAELDINDVDLGAAVYAAWTHHAAAAAKKGLDTRVAPSTGVVARTDGGLLDLLVANLLDNAVAHTPAGGRIASTIQNVGSTVTWTLVNAPVDLDAADLAHVAEPLWRKDPARSRRDHAGLGLALATSVAAVLGGTLAFDLDGDSFRVVLAIPANASTRE